MVRVVVGGSSSGVGKTTLICDLIRALPEFGWTVIKITAHSHGFPQLVFEERQPGEGSDTARYLSAGAHRSFLVTASGTEFPAHEVEALCEAAGYVLIESNRVVDTLGPDVCVAVVGAGAPKPSFHALLQRADCVVVRGGDALNYAQAPASARIFYVNEGTVTPEFIAWMREKLAEAKAVSIHM